MRHSRISNNQTELLSIVQSIQRHLESNRKQQNRITPAIARTLAMKIDNSIRKLEKLKVTNSKATMMAMKLMKSNL